MQGPLEGEKLQGQNYLHFTVGIIYFTLFFITHVEWSCSEATQCVMIPAPGQLNRMCSVGSFKIFSVLILNIVDVDRYKIGTDI